VTCPRVQYDQVGTSGNTNATEPERFRSHAPIVRSHDESANRRQGRNFRIGAVAKRRPVVVRRQRCGLHVVLRIDRYERQPTICDRHSNAGRRGRPPHFIERPRRRHDRPVRQVTEKPECVSGPEQVRRQASTINVGMSTASDPDERLALVRFLTDAEDIHASAEICDVGSQQIRCSSSRDQASAPRLDRKLRQPPGIKPITLQAKTESPRRFDNVRLFGAHSFRILRVQQADVLKAVEQRHS
jgi:hypothetical protein